MNSAEIFIALAPAAPVDRNRSTDCFLMVAMRTRAESSIAVRRSETNAQCRRAHTNRDMRLHRVTDFSPPRHAAVAPGASNHMPASRRPIMMAKLIVAAALVAAGANAASAQSVERGYVVGDGGFAVAPDGTSGDVVGEVGVRV